MRIIRTGVTRTVLVVGRWAIKMPSLRANGHGLAGVLWSWSRGVQANLGELQWSTYLSGHVCPVIWSAAGLVNIYPRCEPVRFTARAARALRERRWRPVHVDPHPGDEKAAHYGWLCPPGARTRLACDLVVLDYDLSYNGCPHDHSGARNRLEEVSCP